MADIVELFKVEKLRVQFPFEGGWKTVVDCIDFSIKKGEILGLVGESGSGKTMSALFILGLISENANIECNTFQFGDKILNINDLQTLSDFQKSLRGKSIGMIFQEPMSALNPTITCGKQLTEAILLHLKTDKKTARKRAKSYLKKVQLPESYFDRYPHQLSGGQQQRVMIALAICCEPQLLIADEPTTALDATVRKEILTLLKNLSESEKLAMLFISHDLPAVGSIADRILVMRNGEIVERGSVVDILKNPTHEYTQGLLNCLPTLDFDGERLPTLDSKNEAPKSEFERSRERKHEEQNIDSSRFRSRLRSNSDSEKEQIPILKIQNLSVTYQNQTWLSFSKKTETRAVIDLNFEVFEGETLGIVGESGSGKSSLGKAIINLVDSKSGGVFYKNQNLTQLPDNQWFEFRKDLQFIFQNPLDSLNPRQSIGLGLIEVLSVFKTNFSQKEKENRVIELLKKVGLSESDFFKYPHEFSGGQRQRISIARALAVEPKILICDECVSSLDVSVQAQILNLLKDLQEQFGLTMLFISHDLGVVKFMSDRILVMKDGREIQLEETEKLFKNPEMGYVKELIDSVPKS